MVDEIREEIKNNVVQSKIAEKFGITPSAVSRIKSNNIHKKK